MKKNKKALMIIVLLVLIVLTTAWAFSKYTTTVTGNGTARVAAWSFEVNGPEGSTIENVALTDTTIKEGTLVDGRIAPGTSGSFDIEIDASGSEVGVDYIIEISGLNAGPKNLVFTADGLDVATDAVNGKITFSGAIAATATGTPVTKTINWAWAYETPEVATNDVQDTTDSGSGDLTYTIKVVGTQQNPTV